MGGGGGGGRGSWEIVSIVYSIRIGVGGGTFIVLPLPFRIKPDKLIAVDVMKSPHLCRLPNMELAKTAHQTV